jgi:uncharacterized protein (TIGR03083 family)
MGRRELEEPGAAPRRGEDAGVGGALAALREECELTSQLVLGLPEEDFAKPTRLPAWNVKELLAHTYTVINRINMGLDEPPPPAPDSDSVSYWRMYDPATDSQETADAAKEIASQYESGGQLASAWDELWRRAVGRAADEDPERVVAIWGLALALDELVRDRVLEMTVHRIDLMDALGLPPEPSEAGLEITEEILLALLDADPRSVPDWNGVELIEKGTGRRPLSDEDRKVLGDLADRFPLLT